MPPIETLINISLSHTSIHNLSGYCAEPNAQLHAKIFLQGGQTKTETKQQRDKILPKRPERDKETKAKTTEQRRVQKESKKRAKREQKESKKRDQSQKERAKERAKSPKRVASKDQQGEVPDPSFEGVCLSADKVPNQD